MTVLTTVTGKSNVNRLQLQLLQGDVVLKTPAEVFQEDQRSGQPVLRWYAVQSVYYRTSTQLSRHSNTTQEHTEHQQRDLVWWCAAAGKQRLQLVHDGEMVIRHRLLDSFQRIARRQRWSSSAGVLYVLQQNFRRWRRKTRSADVLGASHQAHLCHTHSSSVHLSVSAAVLTCKTLYTLCTSSKSHWILLSFFVQNRQTYSLSFYPFVCFPATCLPFSFCTVQMLFLFAENI